jgi:hypothetical protein
MYYFILLILIAAVSMSFSGVGNKVKQSNVAGETGSMLCESSAASQTTQIQGCSFIADSATDAAKKLSDAAIGLRSAIHKADQQAIAASAANSILAYASAKSASQDAQTSQKQAEIFAANQQLAKAQNLAVISQKLLQSDIPTPILVDYAAQARVNMDKDQLAAKETLDANSTNQKYPVLNRAIDSTNLAAAAQVQVEGKLKTGEASLNQNLIRLLLPNYLSLINLFASQAIAESSDEIVQTVITSQKALYKALKGSDTEKVSPLYQQLLRSEESLTRSAAEEAVAKAKDELKNKTGYVPEDALIELSRIIGE